MKRGETVILAAGDFPRKGGTAWRLLANASRVVCCDGAADTYRRRMKRMPTVVVGDCDSLKGRFPDVVRIDEQDTNDLEKAATVCRERGWKNPIVVGATGIREDHTLGNVFRALSLNLEAVTDFGRFIPFVGSLSLPVQPGMAVSVFAPDPNTRMTSRGLKWKLDRVVFSNLFCATLNRATGSRIRLTATKPVMVYLADCDTRASK